MSDNCVMKYMLTDHLPPQGGAPQGSTIAVADSAGTLLEQTRYMPFGTVRTDVGTLASTDRTYMKSVNEVRGPDRNP
jgi:hypothetical protein